jgi:hypothetical protein
MLRLGMLRIALLGIAAGALAVAEGFTFTIGSPVASQEFQMKTAAFVFRTEGCADPAKPEIVAVAEGIVKGARKSVVLRVLPGSKPNIYAVFQQWPQEGDWVVSLKGRCANANAGAVVPIGPKGFIRESSKFFPRAATDAEVESSLKALVQAH